MKQCKICGRQFQSLGFASHRASCVRKNRERIEQEKKEPVIKCISPNNCNRKGECTCKKDQIEFLTAVSNDKYGTDGK